MEEQDIFYISWVILLNFIFTKLSVIHSGYHTMVKGTLTDHYAGLYSTHLKNDSFAAELQKVRKELAIRQRRLLKISKNLHPHAALCTFLQCAVRSCISV